jgi:hypothetical protein
MDENREVESEKPDRNITILAAVQQQMRAEKTIAEISIKNGQKCEFFFHSNVLWQKNGGNQVVGHLQCTSCRTWFGILKCIERC